MLGFDNYRTHLSNIKYFLKKHNIKFISSGEFNVEALEVNKALGIENICDFSEVLKGQPSRTFRIDAGHYTVGGNRLLAEYLYNFLNKNELLNIN